MAPFLGIRTRSYAMVPSKETKLARATTVLTLAGLLQSVADSDTKQLTVIYTAKLRLIVSSDDSPGLHLVQATTDWRSWKRVSLWHWRS